MDHFPPRGTQFTAQRHHWKQDSTENQVRLLIVETTHISEQIQPFQLLLLSAAAMAMSPTTTSKSPSIPEDTIDEIIQEGPIPPRPLTPDRDAAENGLQSSTIAEEVVQLHDQAIPLTPPDKEFNDAIILQDCEERPPQREETNFEPEELPTTALQHSNGENSAIVRRVQAVSTVKKRNAPAAPAFENARDAELYGACSKLVHTTAKNLAIKILVSLLVTKILWKGGDFKHHLDNVLHKVPSSKNIKTCLNKIIDNGTNLDVLNTATAEDRLNNWPKVVDPAKAFSENVK
ncbi:hypothetical protein HDU96_009847 [Phlyctochytrium bullatum]|nr:hypothetical protein HDU96_009847 [Phlyctochytrium bullatum]